MALVTYDGVTLPYAFLTEFLQEPVADDVGGVDRCLTRVTMTAQTIIHFAYLRMLASSLMDGNNPLTRNPADIMNAIRDKLLGYRKRWSVKINEVEQVPAIQDGNAGVVDAQNGPMPQFCNVTDLTDSSYLMTYKVVGHYWENPQIGTSSLSTNPGPGGSGLVTNKRGASVLFNRWSETVDINGLNYSTRVREGKYKIRSDNANGEIADALRDRMAVVGIPQGFLRDGSSYAVTPDGLAISYRVTDKEVFKMPPAPALKATGTYYETTTNYGYKRFGGVRLSLEGGKTTDQAKLLETAVGVASSKLVIAGALLNAQTGGFAFLDHSMIEVDMYENRVSVDMRCLMKPGGGGGNGLVGSRFTGVNMRFGKMTFTPQSDGVSYKPSYPIRGTADLPLLKAAAYYDPSILGTVVDPSTNQLSRGLQPGQAGKTLES